MDRATRYVSKFVLRLTRYMYESASTPVYHRQTQFLVPSFTISKNMIGQN